MKNVLVKLGSIARRGPSADGAPGPSSSGLSGTQKASVVEQQVARMKAGTEGRNKRQARLANLQPFVVDGTLVECLSTGYESLEDKLHAFQAIRQGGIENIMLATFVRGQAPDVQFLQALRSEGLIDAHCWASSELFDAHDSDLPGQDLPFGLARMIQYGIQNAVLECDLVAPYINWDRCPMDDLCALVESRCRWVSSNLYAGRPQGPVSWVRLRDFGGALQAAPERVAALVDHLGRLPAEGGVRPGGLLLQLPGGWLPGDVAAAVSSVRAVMEAAGWADGQLIIATAAAAGGAPQRHPLPHPHPLHAAGSASGGGLAAACVVEALAAGGSGVLAAMCPEGAGPSLPCLLALAHPAGNTTHVAAYTSYGPYGSKLRDAAVQVAAAMGRAAEARLAAVADDGEPVVADFAPQPRQRAAAPSAAAATRTPLIPGHA